MRKTRMTPLGANTFAIRVDSYVAGEMKGVVDGIVLDAPVEFQSLTGLVLMLDEIMESEEFPTAIRTVDTSFTPTIELEVLFRQNHSWQGRVVWPEGQREIMFRSVLELLTILETLFGA